ncbi:alpha/beta fold hydrolase [Kordiimonas aestuarii]|uniref:alpha/beta fold hydrolase n=1 Tax=Kordiimonas aestuarii TaxID=1005925 RepID=UPI0021CE545A|nr:alpha/beta hydrolase [Kordiimonas aestuarii]
MPEGDIIMTNSCWFNFTEGTDGQSLIWLHGWGMEHASLKRLASLFKTTHKSTLYDQPGFGRTPKLADGAGTEDYADDLAAELEGIPGAPHILIGHSFGGRVAVQMAARHPSLVKAIILIGGAGLQRRRSLRFKLRAYSLRNIGRLARLSDHLFGTHMRAAYVERFGSTDYKNAGPLRPTFVRVVNEDLSQPAKIVRCPALLIYGSDDTEAPPEIGRRFESLIPIARFVEVRGFDHWDILGRGAYQCEALIRAFMEDLKDD